jgi:hypothetical protein
MSPRALVAGSLLVAALVVAAPAAAKEFKPGDLRVCNAKSCVTPRDQKLLDSLASFIYMGRQPVVTKAPRLGVPYLELRFSNGYVAGIVATAKLDRWLSYGVYLERFRRGTWYRVPAATASALKDVAASLQPRRLTRIAVKKSR